MAKLTLRSNQWGTIFASVENRGKTLKEEAQRLKIPVEDLITCGDEKFARSPKRWEACKRLSEKREKKQTLKKRTTSHVSAPATISVHVATAPTDPMEELLLKKEELQRSLKECKTKVESVREILQIRLDTLNEAKSVLEKAQLAVKNAETDANEAHTALSQAEAQQETVHQDLQKVEVEIQKLSVYLVAPTFSGTFPEFGTFFSTIAMEGVNVVEPTESIEPEFKDMVSSGFDLGSEYMRALAFVALVQEYIMEGKEHKVLNDDPRLQRLIEKHIG